MARSKAHITPESGRVAVTLDKRQLKEFKKIGIEFEMENKAVMQLAVDLLIKTYQRLSPEQIDAQGVEALFESARTGGDAT